MHILRIFLYIGVKLPNTVKYNLAETKAARDFNISAYRNFDIKTLP